MLVMYTYNIVSYDYTKAHLIENTCPISVHFFIFELHLNLFVAQ